MNQEVTIKLDAATATLILDAITERTLVALARTRSSQCAAPRPAAPSPTPAARSKPGATKRHGTLDTFRTRLDAGTYLTEANAMRAASQLPVELRDEARALVKKRFGKAPDANDTSE